MRISLPRAFRYCVFEYRKNFPYKNYGEIPGTHNPADKMPWDIFAPGYNCKIPENRLFKIKDFLGVYFLENGNHKIAVRVNYPGFTRDRLEKDIKTSCKNYTKKTGVKGVYVPLK